MAGDREPRKLSKLPKASSCRMFDTPLIEHFSRIHPASPFAFWLPVLFFLLGYELCAVSMAPRLLCALFAGGWLFWSLTEYALHRFVFHWIGKKPWQRRFHFVFHGVHHDFPQDSRRLVFPIGVSVPIGLAFFLAMDALFARPTAIALFCGFGAGYLAYDGIHYFTHHLPARRSIGKFVKRYHMVHHHAGVRGMWGVSQPLWDYVFGTQHDARGDLRRAKPTASQLAS